MSASLRDAHRVLAAGALTLAVLAALIGSPESPARATSLEAPALRASRDARDRTAAPVVAPMKLDALQLAAWIREGTRDLRVLDLRGDSAYDAQHIPSAEPIGLPQLDSLASKVDATLVLYSDDDVRDIQAWANLAARGHRRAYVLSGGMSSWVEEVMEPVLRGDSADYVAALSRYFGGAPRTDEVRDERASQADVDGTDDSSPAATDEFGQPGRRGC